jgi:hypothetical protein
MSACGSLVNLERSGPFGFIVILGGVSLAAIP